MGKSNLIYEEATTVATRIVEKIYKMNRESDDDDDDDDFYSNGMIDIDDDYRLLYQISIHGSVHYEGKYTYNLAFNLQERNGKRYEYLYNCHRGKGDNIERKKIHIECKLALNNLLTNIIHKVYNRRFVNNMKVGITQAYSGFNELLSKTIAIHNDILVAVKNLANYTEESICLFNNKLQLLAEYFIKDLVSYAEYQSMYGRDIISTEIIDKFLANVKTIKANQVIMK